MKVIKVKENQTIFDILIQEYGSIIPFDWLLDDNPSIDSIPYNLKEDQELKIRQNTQNTYVKNKLAPHIISTGKGVKAEGIGFWYVKSEDVGFSYVDEDFIVS